MGRGAGRGLEGVVGSLARDTVTSFFFYPDKFYTVIR